MLIVLGFFLKHNDSSQVTKQRKMAKMHISASKYPPIEIQFYLIVFFRTVVGKFRDDKKDGHVGIILRISRENFL